MLASTFLQLWVWRKVGNIIILASLSCLKKLEMRVSYNREYCIYDNDKTFLISKHLKQLRAWFMTKIMILLVYFWFISSYEKWKKNHTHVNWCACLVLSIVLMNPTNMLNKLIKRNVFLTHLFPMSHLHHRMERC